MNRESALGAVGYAEVIACASAGLQNQRPISFPTGSGDSGADLDYVVPGSADKLVGNLSADDLGARPGTGHPECAPTPAGPGDRGR